jgi:opacity protein-like surface antigen
MKTLYNIILIAAALMFISNVYSQDSIKSSPQDSVKNVILSDKTGEVIDKTENEKYNVFPNIENLDSVRILWSPEKKYFVQISMRDKNKSKEFHINEENIIRLTERIELKKVIDKGYFKPGLSEISIDTSATTMTVKFKNEYFEELPWVKNIRTENKFHPHFGAGIGFKLINMDLSGMKEFYDYVEQTVRSKGYSISSNNLDNGPRLFYAFNFYIYLIESFGFYFETGQGLNSNWESHFVSGSLKYYFNLPNTDWIKPYFGAGYTIIGFKGQNTYEARISPINEQGYYWVLKDISTEGNSKGFTLSAGAETGYFDYDNHFYFTLFADISYALFPEKTYKYSQSAAEFNFINSSSTSFKGLMLTSGIKIYF